MKTFEEVWKLLEDTITPHPDAPDLYPGDEVERACSVFFELGRLAGVDRHNEIVNEAFLAAIKEVAMITGG